MFIRLKGEQMIADQFLETNLWTLLWQRVAQSLKPENESADDESEQVLSIKGGGGSGNEESLEPIDWTLISPNGYLSLLQLASRMFTVSSQNCAALIMREDSLMFDSMSCMLTERFLTSIKKR